MKINRFSRRFAAVTLLICVAWIPARAAEVTLMHVHGLSYSADGKQLFIPSHQGLAIYGDGKWRKAPGPEHDFMGFSAAKGALYSSGHPAPGSALRNPFGLLKSRDGGRTWDQLGLTGEADFHVMAASYGTHTVYVYSPAANSRMPEPGVYHTSDDGKTWTRSAGAGLSGRVVALAEHPARASWVAAATEAGLFLSEDAGDRFTAVAGPPGVSALFDLDGGHLWFGGYVEKGTLTRMDLKTRKSESVPIPPLVKDAVAYIAQNPANRTQYAIATFARNVYLSDDGGKSWKQIADRGETR